VKQPGSAPERLPLFTRHHPRCTHVQEADRTLAQRLLLTNLFALAAALRLLEQARVTALPAQHRVPAQYDANSPAPPRAQHRVPAQYDANSPAPPRAQHRVPAQYDANSPAPPRAQHRVPAQYDANSPAPPRAQHALTSVVAATHLAATASARLTGSRLARFPIRPFFSASCCRARPLDSAAAPSGACPCS
jgi:hypothetical protein